MAGIFNALYSCGKILKLWFKGRKITPEDYARDYDSAAPTYSRWVQLMRKNTDNLLPVLDRLKGEKAHILDFCCGTGYISERISKLYGDEKLWSVLGIDISRGMVREAEKRIRNSRVRFSVEEGAAFLEKNNEKFDAILCGWALVYFQPRAIISLMASRLKKGALAAVILNARGTLKGVEKAFVKIMRDNPEKYNKIMDIRFSLPSGEKQLSRWFSSCGFKTLESGSGEETAGFETPGELLDWLGETGAIAGTSAIMEDREFMKEAMEKIIEKKFFKNNQYRVNHKFVYGIFEYKGE